MIYTNRQLDDPKLPPRHKALVEEVIRRYVDYLNEATEGYVDEPYTPNAFLDKDHNPYANTYILFAREQTNYPYGDPLYMELSVYDGDDGGASTLYIHAEREWHWQKTGRTHHGMYLEYYDIESYGTEPDGTNKVIELDPPREHHYDSPESKIVKDDAYRINFLIHEFDTTYTPIPIEDHE